MDAPDRRFDQWEKPAARLYRESPLASGLELPLPPVTTLDRRRDLNAGRKMRVEQRAGDDVRVFFAIGRARDADELGRGGAAG